MTQIGAMTATATGKTGLAGKTAGAKAGGTDFAAVMDDLAALTGDAGTGAGEAEGLALTGDGSAATDEGKGDDSGKPGDPVILDLALAAAAAAQGVIADPIARPIPAQTAAKAEATAKDTPAIASGATDRTAPMRPNWLQGRPLTRMEPQKSNASALADAAPAADGKSVLPATTLAAPEITAETAPAVFSQTAPMEAVARKPAKGAKGAPAKDSPLLSNTATPRADKAQADQPIVTAPADAAAAAAAVRMAMPVAAAKAEGGAQPAIAVMVPQPAQNAEQTAAMAVGTEAPMVEQAEASAARPVMSTLRRAEATPAREPAVQPLPSADAGQKDSGAQSRDRGSDESGNARFSDSTARIADTGSSAASSGPSFTDIVQNLPPVVQSRIGGVGDVAAVTGPVTDVGQQLDSQVIDMSVSGQWIDRMAKEITNLAEGNGHSRFQLSPPNLGRIQIDVWQGEEGGRVQFLTETDEAAQRLRDGQSTLQADARLASLSLTSISIDKAQGQFDGGRDQNGQNSQNGQQSSQNGSQQHGQRQHQQSADMTGQGNQPGTGGQANNQAGAQGNNPNGQGKGPVRQDVIRERAGTQAQDMGSARRDGDRLVRYA